MVAEVLTYPDKLEIDILDGDIIRPVIRVTNSCIETYGKEPEKFLLEYNTECNLEFRRRKRSVVDTTSCFEWSSLYDVEQLVLWF